MNAQQISDEADARTDADFRFTASHGNDFGGMDFLLELRDIVRIVPEDNDWSAGFTVYRFTHNRVLKAELAWRGRADASFAVDLCALVAREV